LVKRTLELFECDVCGGVGERYTVIFPVGQMTLDRCTRHNSVVEKLRSEKGSWVAKPPGSRTSFKITSPDEIKKQQGKK
jgi:hypothetical protein